MILIVSAVQPVALRAAKISETIRRIMVPAILKGVWHEIFDFRFLYESYSSGTLRIPLKPFPIFTKIRGDICNFVFIAGVNDAGDKLFTGVNATGDKLSLSPAINYSIAGVVDTGDYAMSRVFIDFDLKMTPAMINRR